MLDISEKKPNNEPGTPASRKTVFLAGLLGLFLGIFGTYLTLIVVGENETANTETAVTTIQTEKVDVTRQSQLGGSLIHEDSPTAQTIYGVLEDSSEWNVVSVGGMIDSINNTDKSCKIRFGPIHGVTVSGNWSKEESSEILEGNSYLFEFYLEDQTVHEVIVRKSPLGGPVVLEHSGGILAGDVEPCLNDFKKVLQALEVLQQG